MGVDSAGSTPPLPPPAKLTPPRDLQRSAVAPAAARSCSNLAGLGAIRCLRGPNCACRASQRAEEKDGAVQGRQEKPWMVVGSWALTGVGNQPACVNGGWKSANLGSWHRVLGKDLGPSAGPFRQRRMLTSAASLRQWSCRSAHQWRGRLLVLRRANNSHFCETMGGFFRQRGGPPNTRRGIRQACTRRGHLDASQFLPSKDRPATLQLRPRHLRVPGPSPNPRFAQAVLQLYWLATIANR